MMALMSVTSTAPISQTLSRSIVLRGAAAHACYRLIPATHECLQDALRFIFPTIDGRHNAGSALHKVTRDVFVFLEEFDCL